MPTSKIIIVGRDSFTKFVVDHLLAIEEREGIIMVQLADVKQALGDIKAGLDQTSINLQDIATDEQALLDKIAELAQHISSGVVVSVQDMDALFQQASNVKAQTDAMAAATKTIADNVPDQPTP